MDGEKLKRGRPREDPLVRKSATVHIRVTRGMLQEIHALAAQSNMGYGDWIREQLLAVILDAHDSGALKSKRKPFRKNRQ
jgi:hypothetical protein